MAIYKPGERHRYHNILNKRKSKRGVVALLSLTAMVDMFTVLVIFLLQNFSGDQQMLEMHKDIELPKARSIKELKPAFVVTLTNKDILIDQTLIGDVPTVKAQTDWMIQPLFVEMQKGLQQAKIDHEAKLQNQIRGVVQEARGDKADKDDSWNKVTIQADRNMDILTLKKVMYTITEAGAGEINFAVLKESDKPTPSSNQ